MENMQADSSNYYLSVLLSILSFVENIFAPTAATAVEKYDLPASYVIKNNGGNMDPTICHTALSIL